MQTVRGQEMELALKVYTSILQEQPQARYTFSKHRQIHFPHLFAKLSPEIIASTRQDSSCFTYTEYSDGTNLELWYMTVYFTMPLPLRSKVQ